VIGGENGLFCGEGMCMLCESQLSGTTHDAGRRDARSSETEASGTNMAASAHVLVQEVEHR